MTEPDQSIFDAISDLAASLTSNGGPSVEGAVAWLADKALTRETESLRADPNEVVGPNSLTLLGLPSHRVQRTTKREIERLKGERRGLGPQISASDGDRLWNEYNNPAAAVSLIDIRRVPADALAFYQPFHFSRKEWGIYMLAGPLLKYCLQLYSDFRIHLATFTLETLLGCVLFEVFHHEFFHHLVECAAATMEIASAGFGAPKAFFIDYWERKYTRERGLGSHVDEPVEEALANAYAYNSFSFLSRTEIGQKVLWVRVYQKVLEKSWRLEPAGYSSAGKYINGGYISGAAQLLAMLLCSPNLDPTSLLLVAKRVLPNGNSAFLQKAEIPTYFVGSEVELKHLYRLIPVPSETYTTLLWLGDSSEVDAYLKARKAKEKKKKQQTFLSA